MLRLATFFLMVVTGLLAYSVCFPSGGYRSDGDMLEEMFTRYCGSAPPVRLTARGFRRMSYGPFLSAGENVFAVNQPDADYEHWTSSIAAHLKREWKPLSEPGKPMDNGGQIPLMRIEGGFMNHPDGRWIEGIGQIGDPSLKMKAMVIARDDLKWVYLILDF